MSTEPTTGLLEDLIDASGATFLGELRAACDHIEHAYADRDLDKALLWRARLREMCSDDHAATDPTHHDPQESPVSIAIVPTETTTDDVPEALRLVVLAERWARACADREHLTARGDAIRRRVANSRIDVRGRALHAALAEAIPGYHPADLGDALQDTDDDAGEDLA